MTNGFRYMRIYSVLKVHLQIKEKSGDNSGEATPVPISNTEVKLLSADDTWWEAAWESRTLPVLWLHGQAVKTPPFHGGNPGSIPGGVTNKVKNGNLRVPIFP